MTGALVIGQMTTNNALTFNFQGPTGGGSAGTASTFYPAAHQVCSSSGSTC
jgi:hypothetical protein